MVNEIILQGEMGQSFSCCPFCLQNDSQFWTIPCHSKMENISLIPELIIKTSSIQQFQME